jgi:hypothetical protein
MPVMKEAEVRARIRELIVELREVGVLTEDDKIDPPISDLTKMWIEDPQRYKTAVRDAIDDAGGHLPIAADRLGVSDRTLRRHIRKNFAKKELRGKLAPPGPDPEWDVDAGKQVSDAEMQRKRRRSRRSGRRRKE